MSSAACHPIRYLTFTDRGIIMEFGDAISPEINARVRGMYAAVSQAGIPGIVAVTPTYRSLTIEYCPGKIRHAQMVEALKALESNIGQMELPSPNLLIVPTLYGGEYGPDMHTVMEKNGLTQEEVVSIHAGTNYLVYMLGFTPGFSYLGGMDERIETPRLSTPRQMISAGSVGIAGKQTGAYSIDSPGGWQLIGRTPIKLYDPYRESPILHKAGDYIRFEAIDQAEFDRIAKEVSEGSYRYRYAPLKGGS